MSLIYRDSRIENVEEDVEYLKSLIDEGIAAVEAQVQDHETRITVLEDQEYPEKLRNLADVNIPTFLDQKPIIYDQASDKFTLGEAGIPEVLNDGKRYV